MPVTQAIVGFHQDEHQDWVADLACGHTQHVRHQPPWQIRQWVVSAQGRSDKIGALLECKLCDTDSPAQPAPEK